MTSSAWRHQKVDRLICLVAERCKWRHQPPARPTWPTRLIGVTPLLSLQVWTRQGSLLTLDQPLNNSTNKMNTSDAISLSTLHSLNTPRLSLVPRHKYFSSCQFSMQSFQSPSPICAARSTLSRMWVQPLLGISNFPEPQRLLQTKFFLTPETK